jgi:N-acetylglucosaminyl-diphospho-decaprenol L-rhamnosyltransferase
MSTTVSVAVVSFNTRELTLRCLKAAEEAAGANGTVLTVVDNGSGDGTVEAVRRECPAWRVMVAPENPGYGSALNRAFREAPGWSYLTLNSDILLGPDALRILMDFLQRHPECGLVGPALTYTDGRTQPSAKRFPSSPFALAEVCWLNALFPRNRLVRRFYYADQDLANHPWVDTVSGAAMLIRGEAFRRVGGFDEGFRMYFEETDLCHRLHDAGYRVALCTLATAVHWHGASTIQTSVREVEYYLSYVRYFRKHHGPGSARTLAVAVAASTVLRMLALPLRYPPLSGPRREILRGKLAACRRLLQQLWRPPTGRAPRETLP